ncbi:FAD-binding oxidoreductase [Halobacteriovorax sp.]|uniref:FAD-binding oxidoreductase n=1 Tax=Halobacteriovorax sp. TaxID=2020862 RepID=UPI00356629C4
MPKFRTLILLILVSACAILPTSRNDIKKELQRPLSKQLNSFTSDGCSKWPDGTRERPNAWLICCFNHDKAYWMGGTKEEKLSADNQLKSCVEKNFSAPMGILMYLGVSVGGIPDYKTDYRWGYGWNYDRGYLELTEKEKKYATKLLPREGESMWNYIKK